MEVDAKWQMTDEQIERYSRHHLKKSGGKRDRRSSPKGKVLIIGAGGLSAPAGNVYLAATGVGTIGIVDADEVDLNLQRQIIHSTVDIEKAAVKSAKETMNAMNPNEVKTYRMFRDASKYPRTDSRI